MKASPAKAHDVINTVKIEMESMFGVLESYFPPDMEDEHSVIKKIEESFGTVIKDIDKEVT